MIRLFTDVALGMVGHSRGGPAKVAVISSALMGTINGSGVANVVTTGQFTIPLMKRFGYRPAFAGAVEATASMGGQIMPPVMGAVAFIMAETIDVPYAEIVKAAIIPAILYFATGFWMVHLEAGKRGLLGLPADQCPSALAALAPRLVSDPAAGRAGLAAVHRLHAAVRRHGRAGADRMRDPRRTRSPGARPPQRCASLFWIGARRSSRRRFLRYGINAVIVPSSRCWSAPAALVKGGRATLGLCRDSLAEGARHALPSASPARSSARSSASMTLTGVGHQLRRLHRRRRPGQPVPVAGADHARLPRARHGHPDHPELHHHRRASPAPALLELGVPLIVSHMFVFYFGIMADLTPPVALAAFAAAPIAGASRMKIGWRRRASRSPATSCRSWRSMPRR